MTHFMSNNSIILIPLTLSEKFKLSIVIIMKAAFTYLTISTDSNRSVKTHDLIVLSYDLI